MFVVPVVAPGAAAGVQLPPVAQFPAALTFQVASAAWADVIRTPTMGQPMKVLKRIFVNRLDGYLDFMVVMDLEVQ